MMDYEVNYYLETLNADDGSEEHLHALYHLVDHACRAATGLSEFTLDAPGPVWEHLNAARELLIGKLSQ